jgi:hypothetical protein
MNDRYSGVAALDKLRSDVRVWCCHSINPLKLSVEIARLNQDAEHLHHCNAVVSDVQNLEHQPATRPLASDFRRQYQPSEKRPCVFNKLFGLKASGRIRWIRYPGLSIYIYLTPSAGCAGKPFGCAAVFTVVFPSLTVE